MGLIGGECTNLIAGLTRFISHLLRVSLRAWEIVLDGEAAWSIELCRAYIHEIFFFQVVGSR